MMAMAMAELKALIRIHPKTLTDLDVTAAQLLVQLSGEDNSNNNKNQKKKRKNENENENESDFEDEEEFDRRSQNEITSKMMEEIFGKEEEVARPRKKRYRSLVSVYQAMDLSPMNNVWYGNKVSIDENPNGVLARVAEANRYSKTPSIK